MRRAVGCSELAKNDLRRNQTRPNFVFWATRHSWLVGEHTFAFPDASDNFTSWKLVMLIRSLSFLTLVLCFLTPNMLSADIVLFPPSSFDANENTMNATLGITGYTIEDFQDGTLIPGLSITGQGGTTTSFPYTSAAPDLFWDGPQILLSDAPVTGPNRITFSFNPTESFGIGISDEEGSGFFVSVNGGPETNIETLPNYSNVGNQRNAYIRIDRDAGGPLINSVTFRGTANDDSIFFDHLAVSAIPEPTSLVLFGIATIGLVYRRRRS